jgi:2'-5' RNA ligase
MPRLFVAVWLPEEVRARLRELPREGWGDVRWTPEENWHVTLAFLGETEIEDAAQALRRASLPAVGADVSPRLEVMARTSLVVRVAGVGELARAVRTATIPERADRPFRGHITMARSRGGRPIKGRSAEQGQWRRISFDVGDIALVASTLTPGGSRYTTVAEFAASDSR